MFRLFLLVLVITLSKATVIEKCKSTPGQLPSSVEIEGCTESPCKLPQLKDAVIKLRFTAPRDIQTMKTKAYAYLSEVIPPIKYGLGPQEKTCNYLTNATCPLGKDQEVSYTLRMYIQPYFPVGIKLNVELQVVDQNNEGIVCVRVPIQIAESEKSDDDDFLQKYIQNAFAENDQRSVYSIEGLITLFNLGDIDVLRNKNEPVKTEYSTKESFEEIPNKRTVLIV